MGKAITHTPLEELSNQDLKTLINMKKNTLKELKEQQIRALKYSPDATVLPSLLLIIINIIDLYIIIFILHFNHNLCIIIKQDGVGINKRKGGDREVDREMD